MVAVQLAACRFGIRTLVKINAVTIILGRGSDTYQTAINGSQHEWESGLPSHGVSRQVVCGLNEY